MNETKPIWKSNTIWAAIIIVLYGLLTGAQDAAWVKENPELASWIATLIGILLTLWRLLMGTPLDFFGKRVTRKK